MHVSEVSLTFLCSSSHIWLYCECLVGFFFAYRKYTISAAKNTILQLVGIKFSTVFAF